MSLKKETANGGPCSLSQLSYLGYLYSK